MPPPPPRPRPPPKPLPPPPPPRAKIAVAPANRKLCADETLARLAELGRRKGLQRSLSEGVHRAHLAGLAVLDRELNTRVEWDKGTCFVNAPLHQDYYRLPSDQAHVQFSHLLGLPPVALAAADPEQQCNMCKANVRSFPLGPLCGHLDTCSNNPALGLDHDAGAREFVAVLEQLGLEAKHELHRPSQVSQDPTVLHRPDVTVRTPAGVRMAFDFVVVRPPVVGGGGSLKAGLDAKFAMKLSTYYGPKHGAAINLASQSSVAAHRASFNQPTNDSDESLINCFVPRLAAAAAAKPATLMPTCPVRPIVISGVSGIMCPRSRALVRALVSPVLGQRYPYSHDCELAVQSIFQRIAFAVLRSTTERRIINVSKFTDVMLPARRKQAIARAPLVISDEQAHAASIASVAAATVLSAGIPSSPRQLGSVAATPVQQRRRHASPSPARRSKRLHSDTPGPGDHA